MTNEEREIRSVLHDGTEVVYSTGDRVLFLAARPGGMPLTTDPESLYDDLVLTLEQRDATIKELQDEVKKQSILKREIYRENAKWQERYKRLRKALKDINFQVVYGGPNKNSKILTVTHAALREGENNDDGTRSN